MTDQEQGWQDFMYAHINDAVFFDIGRRPKTFEAVECVWRAASKSGDDKFQQLLHIFAPSPGISAEAIPWAECEYQRQGIIIYLAPNLEDKSQDEVNSIVAHEFAHLVLGHPWAQGQGSMGSESRHEDHPYEIEADKLVEKWDFKPAYHRGKSPPQ